MKTEQTKKHWKQMREEDYKKIKTLLAIPVTLKDIHAITGRSEWVLNLVKGTMSFEAYKEAMRNAWKKYEKPQTNGKKVEEPKTSQTLDLEKEYQARFEQKLLNRLDTIISLLQRGSTVEYKM